jgi:hypothetical protein
MDVVRSNVEGIKKDQMSRVLRKINFEDIKQDQMSRVLSKIICRGY